MSWRRFFRRKGTDAELQNEIESFLTEETAENVARGMSAEEARRRLTSSWETRSGYASRFGCKIHCRLWRISTGR